MQPTPSINREIRKKAIQKINIKTVAFILLWILSLGIVFVSSLMIETQFSFAENPNHKITFVIEPNLKEGEEKIYNYDTLVAELKEKLPNNAQDPILNFIKHGENEITRDNPLIIKQGERYPLEASFHIKFNMTSLIIRTAINTLGLILIVFGVIYNILNKRRETDEQFIKASKKISTISEEYRPVIWQNYQDISNQKRKILQWKANCVMQENKLEKQYTPKWFTSKKRKAEIENSLRIWNKGTEDEKLNNHYCYTKLQIREQHSDEWIKNNLEYKLVKYDQISYQLIFSGNDIKNRAENPNDTITKNKNIRIIIENMPRLLIGMGTTLLLSAIVFDITKLSSQVIASILLNIINVAWNTFLSNNYGNTFFNMYIISDIEFRKSIAVEYSDYMKYNLETEKEEVKHEERNSIREITEKENQTRDREETDSLRERQYVEHDVRNV